MGRVLPRLRHGTVLTWRVLVDGPVLQRHLLDVRLHDVSVAQGLQIQRGRDRRLPQIPCLLHGAHAGRDPVGILALDADDRRQPGRDSPELL